MNNISLQMRIADFIKITHPKSFPTLIKNTQVLFIDKRLPIGHEPNQLPYIRTQKKVLSLLFRNKINKLKIYGAFCFLILTVVYIVFKRIILKRFY